MVHKNELWRWLTVGGALVAAIWYHSNTTYASKDSLRGIERQLENVITLLKEKR